MELRAKPRADAARVLLAWLVLGVVAWRAAAGASEAWGELASRPARQHVRAFTTRPEVLVARQLGADVGILLALRAHAAGARELRLSFVPRPDALRALKRRTAMLSGYLYPTALLAWPHDPRARAAGGTPAPGREGFVLDLDSGRDYSRWPGCEVLAEGPDWKLLRLRPGSG
ncbi:MAG TPA: hypothetical protein VF530_02610 [Planctomycetota bacterium]